MTTVEIEIDDVDEFMIKKMTDEEVTVEEFMQSLNEQMIYNTYKRFKEAQEQDGEPDAKNLIDEAE